MTWIIEVVSSPRLAPILQHLLEPTFGEMGLRDVLRHKSEPETCQRSIKDLENSIEDELTFNAHPQVMTFLLKFPCV